MAADPIAPPCLASSNTSPCIRPRRRYTRSGGEETNWKGKLRGCNGRGILMVREAFGQYQDALREVIIAVRPGLVRRHVRPVADLADGYQISLRHHHNIMTTIAASFVRDDG